MAVDQSVGTEQGVSRKPAAYCGASVVYRREATPGLWVTRLRPDVPISFKPGQYCTLSVDDIERPYSIVSAPEERDLELFIELVPPPDGVLTPRLHQLREGDCLRLRPRAKGIFTFDPKYRNHVLVATVTGVAPYVSILRHLERAGTIRQWDFHVLQGASYREELVYDAELRDLAETYPNVRYVPTVSRPADPRNAGWTGHGKRVNLLLEEYVTSQGLQPADTLVYSCGHPGMIDDVRSRMTDRGFPVKDERFWKDD
jgi:ferredoxin--NADP+ reductase